MYPSALPIVGLSTPYAGYTDWSGVLLTLHGQVAWRCEHAHYFDATARDCAAYEKQKRLRGR
jgi:hypothetical protein